jgi:hypothetical protein
MRNSVIATIVAGRVLAVGAVPAEVKMLADAGGTRSDRPRL